MAVHSVDRIAFAKDAMVLILNLDVRMRLFKVEGYYSEMRSRTSVCV